VSVYQFSKDDIAAMVSAIVGTTVLSSHFDIVGLRPTITADNVSANTKARLKFNGTGDYSGTVDVFYNRLDLSSIANFSPYSVNGVRKAPAYEGDALYDILPQVRDAIGIQFTSDGLEAATVTTGAYGAEVVLKAKTTSYGFTGQYTLRLSGYPNIGTIFYSTSMPGF
jgi:hypothetical protein